MFDTLKTAWNLAQRVQEVERRQESVEVQWEDTLDRLKTLTGRLAKRDQREVLRNLEPPAPPQPLTVSTGGDKAALRRKAAASGLISGRDDQ